MKTIRFDMPVLKRAEGDGMWMLSAPWRVAFSGLDGSVYELIVRMGFCTDGASIPRLLWPLCGHPDRSPRVAAAVAHDWLYAAKVLPKPVADFVYAQISSALGVPAWRWMVEWVALMLFGGAAWKGHGEADRKVALGFGSLVQLKKEG